MDLVNENEPSKEDRKEKAKQISHITEFVKKKLNGLLQANADTSPLEMKSDYDISGWMRSAEKAPLSDYLLKEPIHYNFFYTTDQLSARLDQFKRYGKDHNALSKIVTRISNVESLFRTINIEGCNELNEYEVEGDRFVRYTLSN